MPREERKPFFLYIDEFHVIVPGSGEHFEKMLTRARKYNLCMTLANPYPDDLPTEIQRKLPGIATKILFRSRRVERAPVQIPAPALLSPREQ